MSDLLVPLQANIASTPAYVSIRQHTSAYVSIRRIRQHTSAYVTSSSHCKPTLLAAHVCTFSCHGSRRLKRPEKRLVTRSCSSKLPPASVASSITTCGAVGGKKRKKKQITAGICGLFNNDLRSTSLVKHVSSS